MTIVCFFCKATEKCCLPYPIIAETIEISMSAMFQMNLLPDTRDTLGLMPNEN